MGGPLMSSVQVGTARKRLRVGLIGVGRRGQAHLSTLAGFQDSMELVAVCDVNEGNARAAVERHGGNAYTDLHAFFSNEQLDVVGIVTPPESHHLIAKVAADHGVHML